MIHAADLYHTFFNTVDDSIFVVDAVAQTVIEANARAINTTGFQLEELRGLAFDRLFRLPDGACVFFELIDELKRSSRNELLLVKKTGKPVMVNVSATWVERNLTKYLFLIARESNATLIYGARPSAENCDAAWLEQKDFPTIIGQSEKIRDVCRLIGAVAKSDATVLVQGESGTGKEIIANAIHVHSYRSQGPFVKVNCAALTKTLFLKRTLRSCERRFHRRYLRSPWAFQTGRWGHDSPG